MRVLGRVSWRSLRWRCRRRGGAAIGGRGIVGERGGRRGWNNSSKVDFSGKI